MFWALKGHRLTLLSQICLVLVTSAAGWEATFNLSSIDGDKGTVVHGLSRGDAAGFSVAWAGDVDNDAGMTS
jgi:hypothetical protein